MPASTNSLKIDRLISGGVITNYFCSSRCRHCLYNSSPSWKKEYITPQMADKVFKTLKKFGVYSVHIGGGEPFLNFEGLKKVVEKANENGVYIEYIETNASWVENEKEAKQKLKDLKSLGIETILVSISPFHNEYIPLKKVLKLINLLKEVGIEIFPWVEGFLPEIKRFDIEKTHPFSEYIDTFGENYVKSLPLRYYLTLNGRAIKTFEEFFPKKSIEEILENSSPCHELNSKTHFHMDLFGNFIPNPCVGFKISIDDLGKDLDDKKYFFVNMLYTKGIHELFRFAKENFGYKPQKSYLHKCSLCFDIRRFLVLKKNVEAFDLGPREFYEQY
ncbi:Radical SAM domain protein [Caldicellulosiruptor saccharolyticus DSM 8903]|uniref:Radical SAM domain protein n=1 Tax=Caldicellulosiruptor saccharolyticus (strain ATCC 43494 / DSM 8903 / Tp8T 6331) TaxID=351627 RepID=A4XG83_CALS8|nr:radical SAM protein [Caldicellulosiruptor saccharolyticus]ABP65918.1 Radical SAM domain protein [Caldicellulosiruptor saccharolyticus DSM 8903]